MKKFFLFAAAVVAAMTINAQQIITFTEVIAAGEMDGKVFGQGFTLTCTDKAGKMAVDENNCYFGDAEKQSKFELRLKTGGKSLSSEDKANGLVLNAPNAGKLLICARTGSNSATDRNIAISQFGSELLNHVLLESEAIEVGGLDTKEPEKMTKVYPILSCDVAAGEIEITYPIGAINIYALALEGGSQGIENNNAAVKAQKVMKNGQLVIIKNGVEYNALGAQL